MVLRRPQEEIRNPILNNQTTQSQMRSTARSGIADSLYRILDWLSVGFKFVLIQAIIDILGNFFLIDLHTLNFLPVKKKYIISGHGLQRSSLDFQAKLGLTACKYKNSNVSFPVSYCTEYPLCACKRLTRTYSRRLKPRD